MVEAWWRQGEAWWRHDGGIVEAWWKHDGGVVRHGGGRAVRGFWAQ